VIDLVAALRQSVQDNEDKPAPKKAPKTKRRAV